MNIKKYPLQSKKVFVIGGAGFIGSHVLESLLNKEFKVICIDNFSTGKLGSIQGFLSNPNFIFINCDVTNFAYISSLFKKFQPEIVINLSALTSVTRSMIEPYSTLYQNIVSVINTAECARIYDTSLNIFISSSSVYGNIGGPSRKEDFVPSPISPYGTSKLVGEKICEIYNKLFNCKFIILRLFNVFGERQGLSEYAAVIPKFITSFLNGKSPIIYGDGSQTRDFTYVKNVVYAIELVIELYLQGKANRLYGEVLNVATGKNHSVNELFTKIKNLLINDFNRKEVASINPIYSEERKGDIRHSLADISKANKLIGYSPLFSFEEGLKRTIGYYLNSIHKS